MSKVTMPEPALSQVRFKGFACGWLPWMGWEWRNSMGGEKQGRHLITTEQAESYAAAKVREALEEVAAKIEALRDSHCADTALGHDGHACTPDGSNCDIVGAWNDAINIINSHKSTPA